MAEESFLLKSSRFIYGICFFLGGAVKTRFGLAFAETLYGHMSEAFNAAHDVLEMENIITASRFQETIGYIEMLCGFMLLTNQLVTIASVVLMVILGGAVYALRALDQSLITQAGVFMMLWGLLMYLLNSRLESKPPHRRE